MPPLRQLLVLVAPMLLGAVSCAHQRGSGRPANPEVVAAQIVAGDAKTRTAAVVDAARLGGPGIEALVPLLGNAAPKARLAARRAIGRLVRHSTRPGARDEAVAVTDALLDALSRDKAIPAAIRPELLRHTGLSCQGGEQVERIAAFLSDKDLAASALFAIERVPGIHADRALIRGLSGGSALPVAAYARALGRRHARSAMPRLLALAKAKTPAAASARTALAHIGAPAAEPLLRSALDSGAARAFDDWLLYLGERAKASSNADVLADYVALLEAPLPNIRTAALSALEQRGDTGLLDRLLAAMGDPSVDVRQSVRAALGRIGHPDTSRRLVAIYRTAKPRVRGEVLSILTARRDPVALALVRRTATTPGPNRLDALRLLAQFDDPELAKVFVATAKDDNLSIRAAATPGLLAQAAARRRKGDSAGTLSLLHLAATTAANTASRRRVVADLARSASPTSLPVLARLAEQPDLRESVADARLAIARTLEDAGQAIPLIDAVLTQSKSGRTRAAAGKLLARLGGDVAARARRSGMLTSWFVLGPIGPFEDAQFRSEPFGESGPQTQDPFPASGRKLRWKKIDSANIDGIVDLTSLGGTRKGDKNTYAFAFCELDWDVDGPVTLKCGSDDQVAIWINGRLVHSKLQPRGVRLDDDVVPATLRAGTNRILVKVGQIGGGWGFCLRLCAATGEPVDLTAR